MCMWVPGGFCWGPGDFIRQVLYNTTPPKRECVCAPLVLPSQKPPPFFFCKAEDGGWGWGGGGGVHLHISEQSRALISSGEPHGNEVLRYIRHVQIKPILLKVTSEGMTSAIMTSALSREGGVCIWFIKRRNRIPMCFYEGGMEGCVCGGHGGVNAKNNILLKRYVH